MITISISLNCILYVIIGIMTYKNVLLMDEDNVPLIPEEREGYKSFIMILSALWPIFFIIFACANAEEAIEEASQQKD